MSQEDYRENDARAIGHLRSGEQILDQHLVQMPTDLVGNRMAVFAQSGFGKTNAVKIMLWGAMSEGYGKLVFDRRGEYVPETTNERGEKVPGLCEHPEAKQRLVLFTNSLPVLQNEDLKRSLLKLGKFTVDLTDIPPGELTNLYPNITDPQREFLYIYDDDPNVYANVKADESTWNKTLRGWFGNKEAKKLDYSAAIVVRSIRKKLAGMEKRPFVAVSGKATEAILNHLRAGRTVVVDLSGYVSEIDRTFVATLIARKLFDYNLERLDETDPQNGKLKTVIFFEEAQTLLSRGGVGEKSIFIDIAKEGRALEIGLVAITQQPSAISTDILSQFNTFLALHLEFTDDIQFLKKVAGNFEGLDMDLRRKVPGNAYLVTRLKPFAVPLRVLHFDADFVRRHMAEQETVSHIR